MATIGGLSLETDNAEFAAGAAYRLSKAARVTFRWIDEDGSEVIVRRGAPFVQVLVRNLPDDHEQTREVTYDNSQRGLDILSIQGLDDLSLPGGHEGDYFWWRQEGIVTLRCYVVAWTSFSLTGTLVVRKPDGSILPGVNQPQVKWQKGFRYFRLSQTAGDLYEAYRNMYLAFESILSAIVPPTMIGKNRPEPDDQWLRRAYPVIAKCFDSSKYSDFSDPVKTFYDEQYRAYRCALFHAKGIGTTILPGSAETRQQVELAMKQLSPFVVNLCSQHLSIQRQGGAITPYAYGQFMSNLASQLTIAVTANSTNPEGDFEEYRKNAVLSNLETTYLGATDTTGYEYAFTGRAKVSHLQSPIVNAVLTYSDNSGSSSFALIDGLELTGVDCLEVRQTFGISNRGLPRRRFKL